MRGVTESRPPFKTPYEQETACCRLCLLLLCGDETAIRNRKVFDSQRTDNDSRSPLKFNVCRIGTQYMSARVLRSRRVFPKRGVSVKSPSLVPFFCFLFLGKQEKKGCRQTWQAKNNCQDYKAALLPQTKSSHLSMRAFNVEIIKPLLLPFSFCKRKLQTE